MCPDNGKIIVFKHCLENNRMFCFQLPSMCPLCKERILPQSDENISTNSTTSPFIEFKVISSPLQNAIYSQCVLAIRPSKGNFLMDYNSSSDLHISMVTSDGKIVEYDQNGIKISQNSQEWKSCLVIKLWNDLRKETLQNWDEKLLLHIKNERWSKTTYHPLNNNCFDFVITFLRSLNNEYLNLYVENKTKFCEQFVVPKTRILARYISLYRKITSDKIVILESALTQSKNGI